MHNQQYAMKGVVNCMLMRQLLMTFKKWQYEAASMGTVQFAMGGAISRMLHRQPLMAWEKWQFTAAEM